MSQLQHRYDCSHREYPIAVADTVGRRWIGVACDTCGVYELVPESTP